MAVRIDGQLYDIPNAERGFTRYTPEMRASMASSFRLGYQQRHNVGEAFWTHPLRPGVCFPTRPAALRAALATLAHESGPAPEDDEDD